MNQNRSKSSKISAPLPMRFSRPTESSSIIGNSPQKNQLQSKTVQKTSENSSQSNQSVGSKGADEESNKSVWGSSNNIVDILKSKKDKEDEEEINDTELLPLLDDLDLNESKKKKNKKKNKEKIDSPTPKIDAMNTKDHKDIENWAEPEGDDPSLFDPELEALIKQEKEKNSEKKNKKHVHIDKPSPKSPTIEQTKHSVTVEPQKKDASQLSTPKIFKREETIPRSHINPSSRRPFSSRNDKSTIHNQKVQNEHPLVLKESSMGRILEQQPEKPSLPKREEPEKAAPKQVELKDEIEDELSQKQKMDKLVEENRLRILRDQERRDKEQKERATRKLRELEERLAKKREQEELRKQQEAQKQEELRNQKEQQIQSSTVLVDKSKQEHSKFTKAEESATDPAYGSVKIIKRTHIERKSEEPNTSQTDIATDIKYSNHRDTTTNRNNYSRDKYDNNRRNYSRDYHREEKYDPNQYYQRSNPRNKPFSKGNKYNNSESFIENSKRYQRRTDRMQSSESNKKPREAIERKNNTRLESKPYQQIEDNLILSETKQKDKKAEETEVVQRSNDKQKPKVTEDEVKTTIGDTTPVIHRVIRRNRYDRHSMQKPPHQKHRSEPYRQKTNEKTVSKNEESNAPINKNRKPRNKSNTEIKVASPLAESSKKQRIKPKLTLKEIQKKKEERMDKKVVKQISEKVINDKLGIQKLKSSKDIMDSNTGILIVDSQDGIEHSETDDFGIPNEEGWIRQVSKKQKYEESKKRVALEEKKRKNQKKKSRSTSKATNKLSKEEEEVASVKSSGIKEDKDTKNASKGEAKSDTFKPAEQRQVADSKEITHFEVDTQEKTEPIKKRNTKISKSKLEETNETKSNKSILKDEKPSTPKKRKSVVIVENTIEPVADSKKQDSHSNIQNTGSNSSPLDTSNLKNFATKKEIKFGQIDSKPLESHNEKKLVSESNLKKPNIHTHHSHALPVQDLSHKYQLIESPTEYYTPNQMNVMLPIPYYQPSIYNESVPNYQPKNSDLVYVVYQPTTSQDVSGGSQTYQPSTQYYQYNPQEQIQNYHSNLSNQRQNISMRSNMQNNKYAIEQPPMSTQQSDFNTAYNNQYQNRQNRPTLSDTGEKYSTNPSSSQPVPSTHFYNQNQSRGATSHAPIYYQNPPATPPHKANTQPKTQPTNSMQSPAKQESVNSEPKEETSSTNETQYTRAIVETKSPVKVNNPNQSSRNKAHKNKPYNKSVHGVTQKRSNRRYHTGYDQNYYNTANTYNGRYNDDYYDSYDNNFYDNSYNNSYNNSYEHYDRASEKSYKKQPYKNPSNKKPRRKPPSQVNRRQTNTESANSPQKNK